MLLKKLGLEEVETEKPDEASFEAFTTPLLPGTRGCHGGPLSGERPASRDGRRIGYKRFYGFALLYPRSQTLVPYSPLYVL